MRSDERAGHYIKQPEGYRAFEPTPLPPEPPLELIGSGLIDKLSSADQAVGRLDGLAQSLPDSDLFLAMYVRHEALLSSQIEGTECTLDDVLAYEMNAQQPVPVPELDVGEVVNYVAALNRGVELLDELPLCNRLLRDVHATLLRDGRRSDKTPGEFRRSQNWIGPAGCTLENASFIPPPVHEMKDAMGLLERYLHESTLPVILTAGLVHAQFETIHPFLDGNGRTGRLLISLFLHERKVLTQPVLYLSTYLRRHRARYFEHLTAVREEGAWENWLSFFLDGITESARHGANTAAAVHRLRERDRQHVSESGGLARDLILLDKLYAQPLVNAAWVERQAEVTATTATKTLERLEGAGVLREITGKKRYRVYRYDNYLDLFEQPLPRSEGGDTLS